MTYTVRSVTGPSGDMEAGCDMQTSSGLESGSGANPLAMQQTSLHHSCLRTVTIYRMNAAVP